MYFTFIVKIKNCILIIKILLHDYKIYFSFICIIKILLIVSQYNLIITYEYDLRYDTRFWKKNILHSKEIKYVEE